MSELKAGVIVTPHDEGMCFNRGSDVIAVTERETEFYLKSEADKVIARHKRKRCLTMAKWCASRSASWCLDPADEQLHKSDFYDKWKKRWRELAEEPTWTKFLQLIHKEGKC